MLAIPLSVLEQEGSLEIQGSIPPDHACWEGTELRFSSPLALEGEARWVQSGEVVVRLHIEGKIAQECRRCLKGLTGHVEKKLDLFFAPVDELNEDEEARPLPVGQTELDLVEAVREEILLSCSPFALCEPECKGLCPLCGADRNNQDCQCTTEEFDPRWDALRALNEE